MLIKAQNTLFHNMYPYGTNNKQNDTTSTLTVGGGGLQLFYIHVNVISKSYGLIICTFTERECLRMRTHKTTKFYHASIERKFSLWNTFLFKHVMGEIKHYSC